MSATNIEFKIVLVGDGGVGKTTYLNQLLFEEFRQEYRPTMGAEVLPVVINTTMGKIQLNIWDCAGQEQFCGLKDGYYLQADGGIIMVDDRKISLNRVAQNARDIRRMATDAPVVMVVNKMEVLDHKTRKYIGDEYSGLPVIGVSAKTKNHRNWDPILYLARRLMKCDDLDFIKD